MNYRYITCLILFLVLSLHINAQKKKVQITAIAFYNLENFFDPEDDPNKADEDFTPDGSHQYTEAVFQQKAHNLATVLEQLGTEYAANGASLIGVAEVEDDRALKLLVSQPEIKKRHYRFVRFDGPDNRGINVALLYNPAHFKILQAQPLAVNLQFAGAGHTRDVLLVHGILLGDSVYVLVNHWPSRSGGEAASAPKRAAAAEVNKQATEQILSNNPKAKIVIMGDLNDDPVSPSVAKVLGTTGNVQKAKSGGLYNPWLKYYQKGLGTLCYDDKWNLFDQIIISGAWLSAQNGHWQYYTSSIFDKDFLKTTFGKYRGYPHRSYSGNKWINGYSDHFPTVIYLIKDAVQQPETEY
jgi:hypothetical protein